MLDPYHRWNLSAKPLFLGLVISLACLTGAYLSKDRVVMIALCVLHTAAQLIFFFHLGIESKPRWNLIAFLFTLLVIIIVIGGSLWIMSNLNYQMMPMRD